VLTFKHRGFAKGGAVWSAMRAAMRSAVTGHPEPRPPLLARPVKNPDYDALFKEVTRRYRKTLAYLAK
jgi:hypothetical protein